MSSIEKRSRGGKITWRAHYRDPARNQRNKSFARKIDAERFLTSVENSKLIGSYIDPTVGRLTVGELAGWWLDGQAHLTPSTRDRYAGILRRHVQPRWGATRLSDVSHSAIQAWISELSAAAAPATVRKTHNVLSLVLALGVRDGRLAQSCIWDQPAAPRGK
jgi:Phage integrase, N-terminal SAM-like domain